ncbi:GNAT family N-acetyltransferase [Pyrococcus yayanosii]|uniref:GNAT family N-acetyltransferase n=1 Tax=Pyrococcus yayanosii TaxID=1008460 RepID=UPI001ED92EA5|nr:GNAT family N-acetyltransferase [Pyrococcus yayanosii]
MDIIIKSLQTDDERNACLEVARNLSEWFNEAGLRAIEEDLKSEITFIALDKEVLGFITVKSLNEKVLEILWMAVRREHRGKGIGSKLLNFVEEWAKEHRFEVLLVKTSGDLSYKPYDETRKFYEKNGFVSVALIDPYPEWGEPALIYVKCLKGKEKEH